MEETVSYWLKKDQLPQKFQNILDENQKIPNDVLFEPNHYIDQHKPWYGMFIGFCFVALFGGAVSIAEISRNNFPYGYLAVFLIGSGLAIYSFISTKKTRKEIQHKIDNNLIREGAFLHKDWFFVNYGSLSFHVDRNQIISIDHDFVKEMREKGSAMMHVIYFKIKGHEEKEEIIEVFRTSWSPHPFTLKEWLINGKIPQTIFERKTS